MLEVIILGGQRAALNNLAIILEAAGSGFKHVVKVNVYLTNMPRDFALMNSVYMEVIIFAVHDISASSDRNTWDSSSKQERCPPAHVLA